MIDNHASLRHVITLADAIKASPDLTQMAVCMALNIKYGQPVDTEVSKEFYRALFALPVYQTIRETENYNTLRLVDIENAAAVLVFDESAGV